ncbi:hypothetical protein CDCA_CDCA01G0413 [Cyanidium caldarium]|uniref:RNA helicase n=1 Tax=Cyanidium caldarium TaxID=2771 RepID=A0AAV9IQ76_CYACA|nr:hypothetical protein CDCA_CDCA01G0413 [Cyanidium caldarium]
MKLRGTGVRLRKARRVLPATEERVHDAMRCAESAQPAEQALSASGAGSFIGEAVTDEDGVIADALDRFVGEEAVHRQDTTLEAPLPNGTSVHARRTEPPDTHRGGDASADILVSEESDLESSSAIRAPPRCKRRRPILPPVDRAHTAYPPFQRQLLAYTPETLHPVTDAAVSIEPLQTAAASAPPPPALRLPHWAQAGLPSTLLDVLLHRMHFAQPTLIQSVCIPLLLSGRSCVGLAETGSGKTLAYVLPLLRHVAAQPRAVGHAPIAVVIAPTRELAVQIHRVIRPLAAAVRSGDGHEDDVIRCLCACGGADIAAHIRRLQRGVEVLVCTPGRLIALLAANHGRVAHLHRVTWVTLDEADRLFDMGFGPQVQAILERVRPDVQLAMFSATLPPAVQRVVRRAFRDSPTHPAVLVRCGTGGNDHAAAGVDAGDHAVFRGAVPPHIDQRVEVLEGSSGSNDAMRFAALLDILSRHPEEMVLVFVTRQDDADALYQRLHTDAPALAERAEFSPQLVRRWQQALVLHGGVEQSDRQFTWSEFRHAQRTQLLIATSLAARGLDIPQLRVVINYHPPSHYEDYVHRVGRTGRAGRPGIAYTLLDAQRDRTWAQWVIRGLESAGRAVPPALKALTREAGERFASRSDEGASAVEAGRQSARRRWRAPAPGYGGRGLAREHIRHASTGSTHRPSTRSTVECDEEEEEEQVSMSSRNAPVDTTDTLLSLPPPPPATDARELELEVNDLPQAIRQRVTSKAFLTRLADKCPCHVMVRGSFVHGRSGTASPSTPPRKLHLFISGATAADARAAYQCIVRDIDNMYHNNSGGERLAAASTGTRYQVL